MLITLNQSREMDGGLEDKIEGHLRFDCSSALVHVLENYLVHDERSASTASHLIKDFGLTHIVSPRFASIGILVNFELIARYFEKIQWTPSQ